jgi:hypothetical protein
MNFYNPFNEKEMNSLREKSEKMDSLLNKAKEMGRKERQHSNSSDKMPRANPFSNLSGYQRYTEVSDIIVRLEKAWGEGWSEEFMSEYSSKT